MLAYIRRKITHLIPITFAVTALSFLFIYLLPGDVVDAIAGAGTDGAVVDQATVEAIRKDLGLDQPIVVRYGNWIAGALTGDLGKSYQTGQRRLSVWSAYRSGSDHSNLRLSRHPQFRHRNCSDGPIRGAAQMVSSHRIRTHH